MQYFTRAWIRNNNVEITIYGIAWATLAKILSALEPSPNRWSESYWRHRSNSIFYSLNPPCVVINSFPIICVRTDCVTQKLATVGIMCRSLTISHHKVVYMKTKTKAEQSKNKQRWSLRCIALIMEITFFNYRPFQPIVSRNYTHSKTSDAYTCTKSGPRLVHPRVSTLYWSRNGRAEVFTPYQRSVFR